MALGLGKIRENYEEPEDTAPEPETVEQAPVAETVEDGGVEASAEPAAVESGPAQRDEFDAVGDLVPEQAAPSLAEAPASPAPEAKADETAAAKPAGEKPEDDLSEDEKTAISAFAKANNLSEEEAGEYYAREKAKRLAQASGMSHSDAQRAVDDPSQQRAMQDAIRAASAGGGAGGGGAIGSLVAGLSAAVKGTAGLVGSALGGATSKFRTVPVDNSPGAVRERTFEHWYDRYQDSMSGLGKAGDDLKSRVGEFNAAFLGTEAASRLRKMAADGGQDLDAFMSDLNAGKGPEAAMEAAREAMADPKVSKAWDAVSAADGRAQAARDGILSNFEKVARNFSDRVDMGVEADRMSEATEGFMQGMKKPVFEGGKGSKEAEAGQEEQQKKFMDRMREIAESVRRMIERLMARFGLAPAR